MRTVSSLNTGASTATMATAAKPIFPPPAMVQRSPWHSPMPYLFGGLAAMLVLIAFALCVLACSFRRLSRRRSENDGERDLEAASVEEKPADSVKSLPEFEEKYLVIMAGDVNPTCLATPVRSKGCLVIGQESELKREEMEEREKADLDNDEKVKQDMGFEDQMVTITEEGAESESENPDNSMEQNPISSNSESESENRTQENPDDRMEQNH